MLVVAFFPGKDRYLPVEQGDSVGQSKIFDPESVASETT